MTENEIATKRRNELRSKAVNASDSDEISEYLEEMFIIAFQFGEIEGRRREMENKYE